MNFESSNLCCGCLCSDRKMLKLEYHENRCFSQIIGEISSSNNKVSLCWECHGQLNSFNRFIKQVKVSYKVFLDYIKEVKPCPNIQPNPKLSAHSLTNIDILPNQQTEQLKTEDNIKTEQEISQIKQENHYNNDNDNLNSDSEEELLINIKKRRKKKYKILDLGEDIDRNKRRKKKYKILDLDREGIEEERRNAVLEEDYVIAMFRCQLCIMTFPSSEDLKDHIRLKHELNATNYKCCICECSFSTDTSHNYHMSKHTRRFECTVCKERFTTRKKAIKHYLYTHSKRLPLQYENIDKIEEKQSMEPRRQSGTFSCQFCSKSFKWSTSLRKHLEGHSIENGQKRRPYCETCRLLFTTSSNLRKHVKTSTKHQIQLKLIKLRKLEETLPESTNPEKQRAQIDEIKSSVHNTKEKYACSQCDKKFLWRGNLLRHVKSHMARINGNLVCKPCNKTFSSIATYEQHMKISKKHVSENDYKYMCSDCGKKFVHKTGLKDHINWEHLKNYIYNCDVCRKVFKTSTALYLHKQYTHNKYNADHLCDHCGKAFPNYVKLRAHILAHHTLKNAYKCNTCNATFSWPSCLSRHVRRVHRDKEKGDKETTT